MLKSLDYCLKWIAKRIPTFGGKSDHPSTQNTSGSANNTVKLGSGGPVNNGNVTVEKSINNNQGSTLDVHELVEQLNKQHESQAKIIDQKNQQVGHALKALKALKAEKAEAKDANTARQIDQAFTALSKGNTKKAEDIFERILKREQALGKEAYGRAAQAALHIAALAYYHDTQKALSYARKATELDPENAAAWNLLGNVYKTRGELDQAEAMYLKALEIFEAQGNKEGMASGYANLGVVYKTRGDLDQAEAMYRKSLEIEKAQGSKEGMASDYDNLGNVHRIRGDLDQAEAMYRKALEIDEALGRKEGTASVYGNLASVYKTRGDLDQAEAMYRKALEINEALGREEGMAVAYNNLGNVNHTRGDQEQAEAMYLKALEVFEALGSKEGMATTYGNLGNVHKTRDDLDQACANWDKALALYRQVGIKDKAGLVQSWMKRAGCPKDAKQ